tara:strand:+ start:140 stop:472 length:333 start_codon:yes stop_codon:yes gene_type:complete
MRDEDKLLLKDILEDALAELEERIEELREAAKPVQPDVAIGRISRMDAIGNKAMSERMLQEALSQQYEIQLRLEQAGKAGFGDCSRCHEPIGLDRFISVPTTSVCSKCMG